MKSIVYQTNSERRMVRKRSSSFMPKKFVDDSELLFWVDPLSVRQKRKKYELHGEGRLCSVRRRSCLKFSKSAGFCSSSGGKNKTQVSSDLGCGAKCPRSYIKRKTGFEPATFSLASKIHAHRKENVVISNPDIRSPPKKKKKNQGENVVF